ncbi:hypothetical protein B0T14DRAFT_429225 [Immersiella caudata]|uniref:Uncharacterized protein n=1 Tax=Immersiella caudata TaxID=314043 RepID=A0AA39WPH2_9PEZI|nr:hypothetical protein B0T14DRAFT_429225 [Immersiella caudata]
MPENIEDVQVLQVIFAPRAVDMSRLRGRLSDEEIEAAVERFYINTELYLQPGMLQPLGMVRMYGEDWRLNAMGIYYRHYFSPHWVTDGRKLWIPSFEGIDWTVTAEKHRRERAATIVRHVLDNEKWEKSEYAWDADAWADVFGKMRDDPAVAVDKRRCYFWEGTYREVSRLMVKEDDTKIRYRTPDAVFGLATCKDQAYQLPPELEPDRLRALMAQPACNLASDPYLGGAALGFPFAVYEAKGWAGDPRVARWQACTAGMVYLNMLEALALKPGCEEGSYQEVDGRNWQVFALTSFGAHWHVLVGYKRPRRADEYAGFEGMSDEVFIFQRLWSARVVTERKAWELLSLVDQIHEWGVTHFRDRVIRHLRRWHDFSDASYKKNAEALLTVPEPYVDTETGELIWSLLDPELPDWADQLEAPTKAKLKAEFQARSVEEFVAQGWTPPGLEADKLLLFAQSIRDTRNGIRLLGTRAYPYDDDMNDPESSTLVELSPAVVSEIIEASSRKRRRTRKD